ncbi:MAG: hypothetical protein C0412_11695 [Flavobacterium sp.]|nr:hypothetical protein [Flavobacterium sp.]
MKRAVCLFILFLFLSITVWGQTEKIFSLSVEKPKLGDKVQVTYNPTAKDAVLKDANEILLCLNSLQSNGMPVIEEIPMVKSENLWKASFEVKDSLSKVILFRFDTEKASDDNNGNTWFTMVYNNTGEAVERAHQTASMLYSRGGTMGFKVIVDKDKAKQEADLEKQFYLSKAADSGNDLTKLYQTYLANKDKKENMDLVVKDIMVFVERNKSNEDLISNAINLLNYLKQTTKADEIKNEMIKINPNGKIAAAERINKLLAEKDKAKQIEYAEKCLREVSNFYENEKETYNSIIFSNLMELKKFDEAYNVLIKMPKQYGSSYNSLAWKLIEKGEQLEKATGWAKIGVELCRKPDIAEKSKYLTTKDWKKNNLSSLAFVLDTYAFGLFQLGKFEEAEKNYEEALDLAINELSEDAHSRFVECLNKNSKFDKALSFAEKCIKIGKTNDKLLSEYKTAYLKSKKGNEKDIDNILAGFKEEGMKKAQEKIAKELVNKPAPLFNLKSLDGKTVNLADLKGKVVVVDFWATWCGPCKASFPALQKVYEKYKSNPDVVILAVNTWESETGKEKEKAVTQFIKENNYTFKVIYDLEDRAKNFASQFGVEGIPTKFILDKEGKIQFKTVGFGGEKTMIDEMDAQFEMLLKDGHKALLK